MRLHFWAPYELISQMLPEMRVWGGGRIVNITSIGGKVAVPHFAPYSASKFALTGFSDAIRAELARDNIQVTTVAPGLMRFWIPSRPARSSAENARYGFAAASGVRNSMRLAFGLGE